MSFMYNFVRCKPETDLDEGDQEFDPISLGLSFIDLPHEQSDGPLYKDSSTVLPPTALLPSAPSSFRS